MKAQIVRERTEYDIELRRTVTIKDYEDLHFDRTRKCNFEVHGGRL